MNATRATLLGSGHESLGERDEWIAGRSMPNVDARVDGTADSEFLAMRAELIRLAFSVTRSREDAEDVVQDVWIRWRRHQDSIRTVRPWLSRVTRNLAIDRVRARAAGRELVASEGFLEQQPAEQAAALHEGLEELRPAFHSILGTLSRLESAVFVLHEGLEWPYSDIALLLDRTESAVRQLGHRARQHLHAGSRRFAAESASIDAAAEAYVYAATGVDVLPLLEVLAPGMASRTPSFTVGDRKILHDVAGIALFERDRLLLCRRRAELSWYPDAWDLPGAHRQHGEPAAACAARAARQKVDISLTNPRLVSEHCEDDFRLAVYLSVDWSGAPRNLVQSHHCEIRLFTREEARQLPLADRRLLTLFDQTPA